MTLRTHITASLLLAFSCLPVLAQGNITGIVSDTEGKPIAGATVVHFSLPDSTILSFAVTSNDGVFTLPYGEGGVVEVSSVGYKKMDVTLDGTQMRLVMEQDVESLAEATVTSFKAASLTKESGKFIFKPGSLDLGLADTYEVLRNTPMMSIEGGQVSILGKGASTLFINGRKGKMSQDMIADYLRSIPPNQIDKIEIITVPGATQKASTEGGIVNLVLKAPTQGLAGSASASLGLQSNRFSPRVNVSLRYAKSKFSASLSFSAYSTNNLYKRGQTTSYFSTLTSIQNNVRESQSRYGISGVLNLGYKFSQASYFGMTLSSSLSESVTKTSTGSTYYYDGEVSAKKQTENRTEKPFGNPPIWATAFYTLKTDKIGSALDLSIGYSNRYVPKDALMKYITDTEVTEDWLPRVVQNQTTDNQALEATAKYTHNFQDGSTLDVGYELDKTHVGEKLLRQDYDGSSFVTDTDLSTHYVYNETLHSFYASYDREWTDWFYTTVGIRAEHTHAKGDLRSTGQTITQRYWDVFPTVSLNFDFAGGDHSVSLDFTKGITRPFYNKLNPAQIWTDANSYSAGNASMERELDYNLGLSYHFLNDWSLGLNYWYIPDAIWDYTYVDSSNTTVSGTGAKGDSRMYSGYASWHHDFFSGVWRPNVSVNVHYDEDYGQLEDSAIYDNESWRFTFTIRNTIKISARRKLTAFLQYYYSTPTTSLTWKSRHMHLVYTGITKEFKFGGKLNVDINNPINFKNIHSYSSDTYYYRSYQRGSMFNATVKFTMPFGSSRIRSTRSNTYSRNSMRQE